ncbi:STAS domain-containing protein [Streptomyces xanthophaeus]|uniref:STAS domain-containing protein n=1 Tax=Streptomyces xanthophaeus TaxID=67385 RepID=UPI003865C7F0|nr:STAS domain-containing protein [Streptomyces xanthophaeus]WST64847.1 STAS domain-containing protein [Streptomyces xanthophaeus]
MEHHVEVRPDEDGVRVIVCVGEFDQDTLEPLRTSGARAAADPAVRRIVLDVSQVAFADSSMLNEMLLLLRTGRLVLAGPLPPQLSRLLDLTQARDLFPIADSVEAASSL